MSGEWRYKNDQGQTVFSTWRAFPSVGNGGWIHGETWVEYEVRDTSLVAGQFGHARFYEGADHDVTIHLSSPSEIYSTGHLPVDANVEALGRTYIADDVEPPPECDESNPCDEGYKCVDGECVPCEEQQATHFQIRAEFEELVTLPDGSKTMYLLSDVYPIGEGVEDQIIQLSECNGVWYYPRIRFCDSGGAIKPYSGNLSFYGYCNPDGSSPMWVNNFSSGGQSHFLGQKAQMDLQFSSPLSIPRILIEFITESEVILEEGCSDVKPTEPPEIEPVEPVEPDEPEEPVEPPDEPEEPVEPLPPDAPPEPQEGTCVCEEYIGLQIKRAADILYDGLILLKREISVVGREIILELFESRKQNYQLSMFLQNQQFQIMQAQHQRLFEIRDILQKMSEDVSVGLVYENGDGLVEITRKGLVDLNDKGLVEHVKDFVEQYEPVTIENEYRVQSHRIIDDFDSTLAKL